MPESSGQKTLGKYVVHFRDTKTALFVIKLNFICTFTVLPSSFKVEVFVTMATRATLKLTRKA